MYVKLERIQIFWGLLWVVHLLHKLNFFQLVISYFRSKSNKPVIKPEIKFIRWLLGVYFVYRLEEISYNYFTYWVENVQFKLQCFCGFLLDINISMRVRFLTKELR